MSHLFRRTLSAALLLVIVGWGASASARTAHAQPPPEGFSMGPDVSVSVVPQKETVRPGEQMALAVVMDFGEGFHAWPNQAQLTLPPEFDAIFADPSSFIPTEIAIDETTVPEGASVWATQYPEPIPVEVNYTGVPVDLMSFAERVVAYIPVQIPADADPGAVSFRAIANYQACDYTVCYAPESTGVDVTLEVAPPGGASDGAVGGSATQPALFSGFDLSVFGAASPVSGVGGVAVCEPITMNFFGSSFALSPCGALGLTFLLLVAALGGFLLNLTPCVLPVIPLKIMGLNKAAGNRNRLLLLGVAMSVGVVAFWLVIGGAIAFIAGFDAISSLFQTGWFSLVVGLVVGFMALGMFGLFTADLPQAVYRFNPSQETVQGSFLFGILTAVLSTPCTAPFMGGAAAWAATQRPVVTLSTFAAIGTGMALPYLVLTVRPGLVSNVPRSGPASELVKQVIGLAMLGVAAFFLGIPVASWLQEPPAPAGRGYWWVVAFFAVAAAGWMAYRTFQITRSTVHRAVFGGLAALVIVSVGILTPGLASLGPIAWTYYTPESFAQARDDGAVIVMDFTAEWCLNCKALEAGVLHQPDMVELLESPGVVPMKVDLTGDNPLGQAKLKSLEWVGIPLLAVYGPSLGYSDDVALKYDSYTQQTIRDAVRQAGIDTAMR